MKNTQVGINVDGQGNITVFSRKRASNKAHSFPTDLITLTPKKAEELGLLLIRASQR